MTVTDRVSLLAALRSAGVPDGEGYEILGLVRLGPNDGTYLFLVERAGRWVVGTRERGLETIRGEYATEAEASNAFHDRLLADREAVRHPTRPRRDVPRLTRKQAQEEYETLRRRAELENAEQERRIAE